jgi:predicted TPR repeat methyltransferase
MKKNDYKVMLPGDSSELDQDEEYFTLVTDRETRRLRLHDYAKVYEVPGLYEEVVYDRLRCDSPRQVCSLLEKEMKGAGGMDSSLRILDFGAGNGMVGECLADRLDCDVLIGLDIIPEAQIAANRDRPDIYDDYYVMDLSKPKEEDLRTLDRWNFNALLTVAALGFGDIPFQGFINAFNLIDIGGWIAFNINDRYMSGADDTGYGDVLNQMMGGSLDVLQVRRHCHRMAMNGEPIHYHAVIGQKRNNHSIN